MTEDNNVKPLSKQKAAMAIQDSLQKNMRRPIGMFHGKELNERSFVNDLLKKYQLIPRENE